MGGEKLADHGREETVAESRRGDDMQRSGRAGADVPREGLDLRQTREDAGGFAIEQKRLAVRHQPLSLPGEERKSDIMFQRGEHLAHGGLRQPQAFRRGGNRSGIDECTESLQLAMGKRHDPLNITNRNDIPQIMTLTSRRNALKVPSYLAVYGLGRKICPVIRTTTFCIPRSSSSHTGGRSFVPSTASPARFRPRSMSQSSVADMAVLAQPGCCPIWGSVPSCWNPASSVPAQA